MASFNRVILVGNLTRDPELRYLASGMAVTDIGLAVNDRRKNANGEWVEETTFVDVTLWGRTAEVASEYLSKGSPVLIEGRLKLDTWEDAGRSEAIEAEGRRRADADARRPAARADAEGGGPRPAARQPAQNQPTAKPPRPTKLMTPRRPKPPAATIFHSKSSRTGDSSGCAKSTIADLH